MRLTGLLACWWLALGFVAVNAAEGTAQFDVSVTVVRGCSIAPAVVTCPGSNDVAPQLDLQPATLSLSANRTTWILERLATPESASLHASSRRYTVDDSVEVITAQPAPLATLDNQRTVLVFTINF